MTATTSMGDSHKARANLPIRVMLVDDSKVARSIFARLLSANPKLEIVAESEDSAEALAQLATLDVDVILLDIEMPKRSGLEALPEISEASGGASIIVVSSFVEENGAAAVQALSLGACDTLAKPGRAGFGAGFSEQLVDKVLRLGRRGGRARPVGNSSNAELELKRPECVAIGASTGGIPPICKLIASLDAKLDCPVFIVQHLPEAFMDFFARQLAMHTDRPVSVAKNGAEILPGHVYVAPGDAHFVCRKAGGKVYADHVRNFSDSRYCPSVDALFSSVADVYGEKALAIILSGMGNDGVAGARLLARKNAIILAQDSDSSVVWGMPGAVVRENLAHSVMTPDEMCLALSKLDSR